MVMSRPSVVPRHAVTVGSLQGGTVIGKTPEERGKLHLEFQTQNFCKVVEEIPARTGKMGQFYLGFYTPTLVEPLTKKCDIEMSDKKTPLEQQP